MTPIEPVAQGPSDEDYLADPWARHGWVLAAIWLVFLAFPALSVIERTSERPLLRGIALAAVLAFACLYVWGFVRGQGALRCGWRRADLVIVFGSFLAGIAIMVALIPLIGPGAVGMAPFLASVAAFSFPERWPMPSVVAVVVFAAIVLAVTDALREVWFLLFLPLAIGGFGLLLRRMTLSDERHQVVRRSLAVTAERDRVARDVHDVLGHSLTVVSLKADLAERLIDIDPERAKGELADIRSLTRQSLAEIRATVSGLRVARLADERDVAATALRDAGIEASLPEDGEVVDPAHRITMAWVLREAVTNVIRHSGAHRVEVAWGPSWLEVSDDGRGLRGRKEGSGLTGVRERVAQAGGRTEVGEGLPGSAGPGTRVRVELP
ncbi:sensor histidine kinase [Janibacter sp. DB-40]|uniref:sensor histidine kinase n=1 Tax=Janibacter sp. DB-40 TaxID=3028808 RepID=UPI002405CFA2|nr:sensor histidine kinase [Janibacter sp. DB-40]